MDRNQIGSGRGRPVGISGQIGVPTIVHIESRLRSIRIKNKQYVAGEGMLIPVDSKQEAEQFIREKER